MIRGKSFGINDDATPRSGLKFTVSNDGNGNSALLVEIKQGTTWLSALFAADGGYCPALNELRLILYEVEAEMMASRVKLSEGPDGLNTDVT